MSDPKKLVDGKPIQLGGVEYTLPPLPLAKMSKIKALMSDAAGASEDEFAEAFVNAIFWSLHRNYGADVTHDFVESNIDMLNWQAVQKAFMEVNGFQMKEVAATGAPQSGEAQGATTLHP